MQPTLAAVLALAAAPLAAQGERAGPPTAAGSTSVRIDLAFGAGTWEHTTSGIAALSADTDAGYARLGFEVIGRNDFGGGVRLEAAVSDDDLFVDSGGLATEASDLDLFLHGTGVFGGHRGDVVRMPLRFGLFLRTYRIEEQISSNAIDWSTAGPRLEVEPEIDLVGDEGVRWSIYTRVGACFGVTTIDTDLSGDDFDSTMFGLDFGLGTRLLLGPLRIDVSWLLRTHDVDQSDDVGGAFIRAIDSEFRGLVVGAALVF